MTEYGQVTPPDEYNQALVQNVHPPDWVNPTPAPAYNLVVIGGGTAGLVTAAGAAGLGAKVALVERHLLGGDCLNVGCVPSKCLIRSSRALADVRQAGKYGIQVPAGAVADFPAVMARMRRLRSEISRHDAASRFRDLGVDVFLGEGRFTREGTVEVAGRNLRYRKACIATGARAYVPPVEGLENTGFLTNETVFSLVECPRRLAVFGAGPLGCELAQAFQRLGAEVTIFEKALQLLIREDSDAAGILAAVFRRDGLRVRLDTTVKRVTSAPDGKRIEVETNGLNEIVTVDEILVGAGRQPNVEGLGLAEAGVDYDPRRGVIVDDTLRTTNRNIYAAGDVCLDHRFTHTADATARIVIQNALFWGRKRKSVLTIPWCTYTDPEIAHVGFYERDAEARGISVDTFVRPFTEVDRAIADGETEGLVKIHVKKGTERILGATIVARHAGEMISEITLAMLGGLGLSAISRAIHPYPTQAEAMRQAADAYSRTRLTPFLAGVCKRMMRWKR